MADERVPGDWSSLGRAVVWRLIRDPLVWLNLTMAVSSLLVRLAFLIRKGPLDDAIDLVLGLATIVVIIVTVTVYSWKALRSLGG